jgi:chromosome segregation ATPase
MAEAAGERIDQLDGCGYLAGSGPELLAQARAIHGLAAVLLPFLRAEAADVEGPLASLDLVSRNLSSACDALTAARARIAQQDAYVDALQASFDTVRARVTELDAKLDATRQRLGEVCADRRRDGEALTVAAAERAHAESERDEAIQMRDGMRENLDKAHREVDAMARELADYQALARGRTS